MPKFVKQATLKAIMTISYKILLTMVSAVTALVACAPKTDIEIPQAPLEECDYSG